MGTIETGSFGSITIGSLAHCPVSKGFILADSDDYSLTSYTCATHYRGAK